MLNKKTMAMCKPGFKVLNIARGGLVNEGDLLSALNSGHCGGAAMDVQSVEKPNPHSNETIKHLIEHPKVVCTPHLGASTDEAQVVVAKMIADQISDGFLKNTDN